MSGHRVYAYPRAELDKAVPRGASKRILGLRSLWYHAQGAAGEHNGAALQQHVLGRLLHMQLCTSVDPTAESIRPYTPLTPRSFWRANVVK